MSEKPILFNTEMVRAILEGRKTVTRRILKLPNYIKQSEDNPELYTLFAEGCCYENQHMEELTLYLKSPYESGDILYVRETYNGMITGTKDRPKITYWYKADDEMNNPDDKWRPSIYMPKHAARIWLKVTDVRVERLNDITKEQAGREGVTWETDNSGLMRISQFIKLWNSTLKKSDYDKYCWNANPWVWVIEFEKLERNR